MRNKFRVRNNELGVFVDDFGLIPFYYDFSQGKFIATAYMFSSSEKSLELIHPVGKKDQDGKDLFEGDIIKLYGRSIWIMRCFWQKKICCYVLQKKNGVTFPIDTKYPIKRIGHMKTDANLFLES